MSKVQKSLRIEEELAERIEALKEADESEAAAFSRILAAGASALEGSPEEAETVQGGELIESLQEHIGTLKAANEKLSAQLTIKDRQIETLTDVTKAAQTLEGMAYKQLEAAEPIQAEAEQSSEEIAPETKKQGFLARLFG